VVITVDGASATMREQSSGEEQAVGVDQLVTIAPPGTPLGDYLVNELRGESSDLAGAAAAARDNVVTLEAMANAADAKASALDAILAAIP